MKNKNCDCKLFCGDDPWLKSGRSEHCEEYNKAKKALELRLKDHPVGYLNAVTYNRYPIRDTTEVTFVVDGIKPIFETGDKYQLIKIED